MSKPKSSICDRALSILMNPKAGTHEKTIAAYRLRPFRQELLRTGDDLYEALGHFAFWHKCRPLAYAIRLKRLPAILAKLKRFPYLSFLKMQDAVGLRMIFDGETSLYRFLGNLTRPGLVITGPSGIKFTVKSCKDYCKNPAASGYRGVHVVLRSKNPCGGYEHTFELQLRTKTQHIWANTVELVDRVLGTSFKQECNDPVWREFFQVYAHYLEAESTCDMSGEGWHKLMLSARKVTPLADKLGFEKIIDSVRPNVERISDIQQDGMWSFYREYQVAGHYDLYVSSIPDNKTVSPCVGVLDYEPVVGNNPDVLLCKVTPIQKETFAYMNYFGAHKYLDEIMDYLRKAAE